MFSRIIYTSTPPAQKTLKKNHCITKIVARHPKKKSLPFMTFTL